MRAIITLYAPPLPHNIIKMRFVKKMNGNKRVLEAFERQSFCQTNQI